MMQVETQFGTLNLILFLHQFITQEFNLTQEKFAQTLNPWTKKIRAIIVLVLQSFQ